MRIKLLILWLILITVNIRGIAQTQFQNSGFETWTNKTAGTTTYSEPANWYTLNSLKQFGYEESTVKTTIAHSGLASAFLESKQGSFNDIPGLLCINNFLDATGYPDLAKNKIAFTDKPVTLKFWFKSLAESGDQSAVALILSKWNTTTLKADTIGYAAWANGDPIDSFVQAKVLIKYLSTATPDSIFFIASSSNDGFNPTPGSRFWLDDIYLDYTPNGLSNVEEEIQLSIYPNPIQNILNIDCRETINKIRLYDQLGREMPIEKIGPLQIDISGLSKGFYYLKAEMNNEKETKPFLLFKE